MVDVRLTHAVIPTPTPVIAYLAFTVTRWLDAEVSMF